MKLWQRYFVAVTLVFMLFMETIRSYTNAENRFFHHWDFSDGLSLSLGVLALGTLAFGVHEIATRLGGARSRHFVQNVFLLAAGAAVVMWFPFHLLPSLLTKGLAMAAVWLGVAFVVFGWPHRKFPLVKWAANGLLVVSPIVPISIFRLLSYPSWYTPIEPAPSFQNKNLSGTPVFIFVFDEWSYVRSTTNGHFLSCFRSMGDISRESIFCSNAEASGDDTWVSLPGLIFQRHDRLKIEEGRAGWLENEHLTVSSNLPSLFQLAKENGFNTCLVGFHLPYRKLLGSQVDYVRTFPFDWRPESRNLVKRFWMHLLVTIRSWHDPISMCVRELFWSEDFRLPRALQGRHWQTINAGIRSELADVIRRCPNNSFVLGHIPLPHGPFVFNGDGSYRGWTSGPLLPYDPAGYQRHLEFMDLVLGQLISQLKQVNKFEQSTIILTGDHSWRADFTSEGRKPGNYDELVSKVPLVIKLPGERHGYVVRDHLAETRLAPLISSIFHGQTNESTLLRILHHSATGADPKFSRLNRTEEILADPHAGSATD